MLDINALAKGIEEYEFWFLLALIVVEIGIDLISRSKRDYKDTGANIAIAIVYAFTSAIFGYVIALEGLKFFSQFGLLNIPVNIWTLILTIYSCRLSLLLGTSHRTSDSLLLGISQRPS